jgi:hypothetical protein
MKTPTWRECFNTMLNKNWGHITEGAKAADSAGYDYFTWNERVYLIEADAPPNLKWTDTGLTAKDL